jgi:hypothetical protein
MRTTLASLGIAAMMLAVSCADSAMEGSLCERNFEPYANLNKGIARNSINGALVDAMVPYDQGDHIAAVPLLEAYLTRPDAQEIANLYLASSYMATGRYFDAELRLDKAENSNSRQFKDPCEWYTVLCWLCTDQRPRALQGARTIATAKLHTYKQQAQQLVKDLEAAGVE